MSAPTATRPMYRARGRQIANILATIAAATHKTQKIYTQRFSCIWPPSSEARLVSTSMAAQTR
jgi:hypothetical protein